MRKSPVRRVYLRSVGHRDPPNVSGVEEGHKQQDEERYNSQDSSEEEICKEEHIDRRKGKPCGGEQRALRSKGQGRRSQRHAANARERARMRVLSSAFSRLKTSLPWVPADTKLSKLDTLRLASSYISHLRQLLQEDVYQQHSFVHPVNLTWPFMVPGRPEDTKATSPASRLCGATA